ncbi:MAG: hypothetical protein ACLGI6_19940, partial [Gammaproteobacteria bacterium]
MNRLILNRLNLNRLNWYLNMGRLKMAVLTVWLAGWATWAPAVEVAPELIAALPVEQGAQAGPTLKRQGRLYRLRQGTRSAYLFGTVHVGAGSFYPLAPEIRAAL